MPRPDRREPHGPQPSQGRKHGQLLHRLPHADEPLRRDGADRSLDASAHAGGDDRLQVAQRLQPMPHRPRRAVGRPMGPQVVSPRLPGRTAPPGRLAGCGAEERLASGCRKCWPTYYRENKQGDEIYRNSLVRLLRGCSDPKKWPVLIAALKDDSPLVRASAAAALEGYLTDESVAALLRATADPVRLVRIRSRGGPGFRASRSRFAMPKRENRSAGRRPSSRRRWRRGPTIGPPIRTWAATTWKAATSRRRSRPTRRP